MNEEERIKLYTAYNNFVTFVRENLPKPGQSIQNKVNVRFETFYEPNFLRWLNTLNLDTVLPGKYVEINLVYEQEASNRDLNEQIDIRNKRRL